MHQATVVNTSLQWFASMSIEPRLDQSEQRTKSCGKLWYKNISWETCLPGTPPANKIPPVLKYPHNFNTPLIFNTPILYHGGNWRYIKGDRWCANCGEYRHTDQMHFKGDAAYCDECGYKIRNSPRKNDIWHKIMPVHRH